MSRKANKGAPQKEAVSGQARGAFSRIGAGWMVSLVCVLLAAITLAVFFRTISFNFVPYDDPTYVYENPEVTRGLSLKTIGWAFSHSDLYLWTPLTTISHMVDCQLYGLQPWGHHLTNVLLHTATVVVLFLALRQMTGALWRSAFVAAVFAIHPLRVESVAWVAERKDVLSGLFFVLALLAYAGYAHKRSVARYLAVAAFFALGIMAKQMVVTLPCVLLLLDYWPLGRFAREPGATRGGVPVFFRLLIEKIPLFALTAASCIQSFANRTLEPGTVVQGVSEFSWLRIENALVSYVIYIGKLFYPVKLSVFYPYPGSIPAWQTLGAVAMLAAVSTAVFIWRKRQPALLTGWFWYLGMMVPVIGFIPIGKEGHADRYTYLPEIGLCIMIAWGMASLTAAWPYRREVLSVATVLILALLARFTAIQASYWSDGVTLWQHALVFTPDNAIIRNFLGYALQVDDGDLDGAEAQFRKSIELDPAYAEPENNLGIVLLHKEDVRDAITHFQRALAIDEGHVEARDNFAFALMRDGKFDEAIAQLQMVIRFRPKRPDPYNNLGNALLEKTEPDVDGSIRQFQKALEIKPDYADAHIGLGNAFLEKGEPRRAVAEYEKTLRIVPANLHALLSLAHVLATCEDDRVRNGPKAVEFASQASDISGGNNPQVLNTLAAAYAAADRYSDAIETARRALELATADGDTKLANELQSRLALYRSNTPLRLPLKRLGGH